MYTLNFIIYSVITLILLIEIFLFVYLYEYYKCIYIYDQVPFVPTSKITQKAIVREIKNEYPGTKLICEIGSGYGNMARFIGRKTKANVIALENMQISALLSKFADLFQTKSKTIKCDAFDYLDKTKEHFDIAIAYLSPDAITKLLRYKNKINTLITIDFAIDNIYPTKTINIGHGFTHYKHKKYPHKIFIYNLK